MTSTKLKRTGLQAAILTILIGSIIYFSYYFTSVDFLVYLEYIFIFAVTTINIIIILRIFKYLQRHKRSRRSLMVIAGFLFTSLILSFIYFYFITSMLDTMRIKLVNAASYELTEIKFSGCKKVRVQNLKPGESELINIKIIRDCAIEVSYNAAGNIKNEVITSYVTTSMGRKITYKIGG
jgi:amino acid transporter